MHAETSWDQIVNWRLVGNGNYSKKTILGMKLAWGQRGSVNTGLVGCLGGGALVLLVGSGEHCFPSGFVVYLYKQEEQISSITTNVFFLCN